MTSGTEGAGPEPADQAPRSPFFSVVMALYNKEAHLPETLASLAAQTFRSFEVIVVDDGSTDAGPELVRAATADELRLLSQKNAGPGPARNRGIAASRGQWVAFLDADDLWLPDHLCTLFGIIEAWPSADLVASAYVRGAREDVDRIRASRPSPPPARRGNFFAEHERVWTSAVAVRTSVLQASGGFGAKWPGEDLELWTRLSLDHALAVQDHVTAIYVQETGGAMDSQAGSSTSGPASIDDPALLFVEAAIAGGRYQSRREDLEEFARRLLLSYVRPALFHGKTRLARLYLSRLRARGGAAPLVYRLLAKSPPGLLRPALRSYSTVKGFARRGLGRGL